MTAPANPFEQLAYNIALQIQDGMIVYAGTGLPMVGAILAKYPMLPTLPWFMKVVDRIPGKALCLGQ